MPNSKNKNFATKIEQTLLHADMVCKDNVVMVFGEDNPSLNHFIAAAQGCALTLGSHPARGIHRGSVEISSCPKGGSPPEGTEALFPTAHVEDGPHPLTFVKFPDPLHHQPGARAIKKMATDLGMQTIHAAKAIVVMVPYAHLLDRHFVGLTKLISTLAMTIDDEHHATILPGESVRSYGSLHLVISEIPSHNPATQEDVLCTLEAFHQTTLAKNPVDKGKWLDYLSFLISKKGEHNLFLFDPSDTPSTRAWTQMIKKNTLPPPALSLLRDDEANQEVVTQFELLASEGNAVFQSLLETRKQLTQRQRHVLFLTRWHAMFPSAMRTTHPTITNQTMTHIQHLLNHSGEEIQEFKRILPLIRERTARADGESDGLSSKYLKHVDKYVHPEFTKLNQKLRTIWIQGSYLSTWIPLDQLNDLNRQLGYLQDYLTMLQTDDFGCEPYRSHVPDKCRPFIGDQNHQTQLLKEIEALKIKDNKAVAIFRQEHPSYQRTETFYQRHTFYSSEGEDFHRNYLAVLEELDQMDDYPEVTPCAQPQEEIPPIDQDFEDALDASIDANLHCPSNAMWFIGKTGSTKTTIIAGGLKCQLTYIPNPDPDSDIKEFVEIVQCPEGVTSPILGHTSNSQTKDPEAHRQPGPNPLHLIDSPGFDDTHAKSRVNRMMSTHIGMQTSQTIPGLALLLSFYYLAADVRLVALEHDLRVLSGMFKERLAANQHALHLVFSKVPRDKTLSKKSIIYALKTVLNRSQEVAVLDPSLENQNLVQLLEFFTSPEGVNHLFVFDPLNPSALEAWLDTVKHHPAIPVSALTLVGTEETKVKFRKTFDQALIQGTQVLSTLYPQVLRRLNPQFLRDIVDTRLLDPQQEKEHILTDTIEQLIKLARIREDAGAVMMQTLEVLQTLREILIADSKTIDTLLTHMQRHQRNMQNSIKLWDDEWWPNKEMLDAVDTDQHHYKRLITERDKTTKVVLDLQSQNTTLKNARFSLELKQAEVARQKENWDLHQTSYEVQKEREQLIAARNERRDIRKQISTSNTMFHKTLASFERQHQDYYHNLDAFCQLGFENEPLCQQFHVAYQELVDLLDVNLHPKMTRCTQKTPHTEPTAHKTEPQVQPPIKLEEASTALRDSFLFFGDKVLPIRVDVCLPTEKPNNAANATQGKSWISRFFKWSSNESGLQTTAKSGVPMQSQTLMKL